MLFTSQHPEPINMSRDEYLITFDIEGDVMTRRIFLTHQEVGDLQDRFDIYSVIRVDTISDLPVIDASDLMDDSNNMDD